MLIGLDLDNTIVNCEELFAREAEKLLERSLAGLSREGIRALVRKEKGDKFWTAIQAEVYGPLYSKCRPFAGAVEAIEAIAEMKHVEKIIIISHKTTSDSAGKNYKLREFAGEWVKEHLPSVIAEVNFTETMLEKIELISKKGCDVFFDDLTDIINPLQGKVRYPLLFMASDKIQQSFNWQDFRSFVANV